MIGQGDRVLLLEPETGRRWLVFANPGAVKEKGLGVYDPARLIDLTWGTPIDIAGKSLVVLRPDLPDLVGTLRRKAAIIQAKDASRIVYELGVGHGDRVLESGIGSGATTLALAWAVGETGRVVVQELREDFQEWAMDNVVRAGLGDRVECHLGDLTQGVSPEVTGPFQAVLLDQPQPWAAIPHLSEVLAPGARVVAYCPQVVQMEQTVRAMEAAGYVEIHAMEIIERAWEVKEFGSRPSHDGIGHTAFLIFGRFIQPA